MINILKNIRPTSIDRKAKKEEKLYEDKVQSIVIWNLRIDLFARPVIAALTFSFVLFNYYKMLTFIHTQAAGVVALRLSENVQSEYIKYSIGLNSILILIIGYWFASSGATSVLKEAMHAVLEIRKNNKY